MSATASAAGDADYQARLQYLGERDQAALELPEPRMRELQQAHVRELRELLAEHGWPSRSAVGSEAAKAAWLVAQHADADPSFQRDALRQMERLLASDEVEPGWVAYLRDRIAVGAGEPQSYGTQGECRDGRWVPSPLADPERVDQQRKAMGLEPLADYVALGSAMLCAAER